MSIANVNPTRGSFVRSRKREKVYDFIIQSILLLAALVSVFTTIGIVLVLIFEALSFFEEISPFDFFFGTTWTPLFSPQSFGVLPLIAGTLLVTVVAMLIAIPMGLGSAIYLSEYAPSSFRNVLKPLLEVLAGVPTVVYGYFAIVFVTPLLSKVLPGIGVFNALSAGIVVGIMIIPMVSSLSEDALHAVPQSLREGAFALGANHSEVAGRIVVPAALSGITASFILGISRAIGETMAVTMAAGATPNLTANPLESIQTITAYIVQVSLGDTPTGTIEFKTIFAVGLTLFVMTLIPNIFGMVFLRRFRNVY